MRHAIRIQPYLSPELFRKLRAYAAAQSVTVSAVVASALGDYLDRDEGDNALIARRLDAVTHAVAELRSELEAVGVGFGRFVRYSFFSAPAAVDAEVVKRAEALYRDFLGRVGEQLRAGGSFTRQVFPPRRLAAAGAADPGRPIDARGGEGQP